MEKKKVGKIIDIEGTLSKEELKKIDDDLDKAEELVKKYHIYMDEAQSVVYGTKTLSQVLKEHKR